MRFNKGIILDNGILYLPQNDIKQITEQKTRFEIEYENDKLNVRDLWLHKVSMDENVIKQFRKWCKKQYLYVKSEQGNLDK